MVAGDASGAPWEKSEVAAAPGGAPGSAPENMATLLSYKEAASDALMMGPGFQGDGALFPERPLVPSEASLTLAAE